MTIESKIKLQLDTKICEKVPGKGGGGCINSGECYRIDDNKLIFVKICTKSNADEIMSGEFNSLRAIRDTNQINVPEALGIVRQPNEVALIMSYIDMKSLNQLQGELGTNLAKLHLHNQQLMEQHDYNAGFVGSSGSMETGVDCVEPVTEFGFQCVTNCGAIAQNNEWQKDWITFFTRNRLEHQIKMIEENYNDRKVNELWSELQLKIPKFFKYFTDHAINIKPSLLHGDLWSGNACESNGQPFIFDPCCFYGHSEYDLAIGEMFGGFRSTFHQHYTNVIGKAEGAEKRIELYQLFHYLNHWNHFGGGYRSQSLNLMKKLNRM
ncbi:Fructosamine-3-kinase [Pseudolycoriella hygida]|uniref:protein-ribulosamine 3-kinase n=1 Tax=Pseudolycoriella hygida TaxID=35572 RepID=A0A9Q0NF17_9DIPT|nr:Fructosamine-3-kinase [Pseudolycoriella hygida]